MDTQGMECRIAGALPLLQRITKAIGLVETIDQLVPWDPTRCRLSPGTRIEALILNILAGRRPLYRVADFYEDTATELIFGGDVASAQLLDHQRLASLAYYVASLSDRGVQDLHAELFDPRERTMTRRV